MQPRNDRNLGVTKFCLAMEDHRRTDAGRVRTAKELVTQFFPFDDTKAEDHLFKHIPKGVRGPVLSQWGIRGAKSAQRDDDDRVCLCVYDAIIAGDIDETIFEDGITGQILVDWVPLAQWWSFWRSGKLTSAVIQKALATARELGLFDDAWFLLNIQGRGGKLKGTDILCDTLAKDQIVAWIRKLHEAGDGSPAGLIATLGWETILTKTAQDALLFALDQLAKKIGLVTVGAEAAPPKANDVPKTNEAPTARHDKLEPRPTVTAPVDTAEKPVETPKAASVIVSPPPSEDSGVDVAIQDFPPIDEAGPEEEEEEMAGDPPSPVANNEHSAWAQPQTDESPKLAEARAAMMAMLNSNTPADVGDKEPCSNSEVPAKPSSLEWGTPNEQEMSNRTPTPLVRIDGDSHGAVSGTQTVAQSTSPSKATPAPPPLPKRGSPRST